MMVDIRRAGNISLLLVLLLIFPSCTQMKKGPTPQAHVQESAHVRQPVNEPSPARQYITAGDYQKAIDFYKGECKRNHQDQAFVKECVKGLEDIKAVADRSSDRENFASAGKTYNILLKNYPDFKGFAHMLSFDRAQLNTKLTNCKAALSKKGFQEYREGNLNEAISVWQGYLAIDPNNADIKKALNTAKLQQKNLQQNKQ